MSVAQQPPLDFDKYRGVLNENVLSKEQLLQIITDEFEEEKRELQDDVSISAHLLETLEAPIISI